MLHKFAYKPVGQPVLADGVVRFVGEPVAVVVAASAAAAEDLADEVDVSIDETTPVIDARAALAAGAPQIHAVAPGNVILEGNFKSPDFDTIWSSAAKIVKVDVRSRRQNATPVEARAGHAAYDASTGRVTLTCTTQMPHLTRTAIADVLGMPGSDLRVVAPDVGGGFGQKMSLAAEYVVLVWLARKLKSAVAWTEDRRENLIAEFPRPRSIRHARRRLRQKRKTDRAQDRHYLQRRRLFLFPDHLRRRAANGHGGNARTL